MPTTHDIHTLTIMHMRTYGGPHARSVGPAGRGLRPVLGPRGCAGDGGGAAEALATLGIMIPMMKESSNMNYNKNGNH